MYRSHDPLTHQPVVVRTFAEPMSEEQKSRLAAALADLCETPLDHPAIARPLRAGLEDGRPYLVQTLLPGVPLADWRAVHGAPPFADAVLRVTQLAAAIDVAAAAGVHHGTLNAGDVYLGSDSVGISGFGLLQALQAAGLEADAPPSRAGDVKALAAIAFQMLFGHEPGEDVDVRPVPGAATTLLVRAFDAALNGNPHARPETALEFAAALQRAIVDAPQPGASTPEPQTLRAAHADPAAEAQIALPIAPPFDATAHVKKEADLPLHGSTSDRGVDEFRPAPALSAPAASAPVAPARAAQTASTPHTLFAAEDREASGSGWFVVAAALAIGILSGFAGGFVVGQRQALPDPQFAADVPRREAAPSAVVPTDPASDQPSQSGQAFSESTVPDTLLPAGPPPSHADSSGTASDLLSAPRPSSTRPASRAEDVPPVRPVDSGQPRAPDANAPAPRPAADGAMQVLSRPAGAEVFVDGSLVGRTPLLLSSVRPGTHDVRIELAGHRLWRTSVEVGAGDRARVAASLER
jgi:hypothetical protein